MQHPSPPRIPGTNPQPTESGAPCRDHSTSMPGTVLDQWFSSGDNVVPKGQLAMSADILDRHHRGAGREGLPACSGQRPEMLLNILQCSGSYDASTTKNDPARNVSRAVLEKHNQESRFR